jgi:hypothetical protein
MLDKIALLEATKKTAGIAGEMASITGSGDLGHYIEEEIKSATAFGVRAKLQRMAKSGASFMDLVYGDSARQPSKP